MNERTIFTQALEQPTPAERSAYVVTACGGDTALRERVEALLRSHDHAGSFLGKPAPHRLAEELATPEVPGETEVQPAAAVRDEEVLALLDPSDDPTALGRLGHYDVLEVIGRGGMGIVL